MSEAVLEIKNLTKHFPVKKGLFRRTVGYVKAVDLSLIHIFSISKRL